MVHSGLIEIDNTLSRPSFFAFLSALPLDEMLGFRDAFLFDSRWVEEFNKLINISVDDENIKFINELREKSFKYAFRATANGEISGLISDDIELIGRNIVVGNRSAWPETCLWFTYLRGEFPYLV